MEVRVRATKSQIEEFKETIIWKDIKREIRQWKRMCQEEYSQVVGDCIGSGPKTVDGQVVSDRPNTATVMLHLGSINGRERAMDYLLSIPDIFIQILEERKKEDG